MSKPLTPFSLASSLQPLFDYEIFSITLSNFPLFLPLPPNENSHLLPFSLPHLCPLRLVWVPRVALYVVRAAPVLPFWTRLQLLFSSERFFSQYADAPLPLETNISNSKSIQKRTNTSERLLKGSCLVLYLLKPYYECVS